MEVLVASITFVTSWALHFPAAGTKSMGFLAGDATTEEVKIEEQQSCWAERGRGINIFPEVKEEDIYRELLKSKMYGTTGKLLKCWR